MNNVFVRKNTCSGGLKFTPELGSFSTRKLFIISGLAMFFWFTIVF